MGVNFSWEILNTLLQLVQTIAVITALIYGWQEIKHARKESRLGSLWNIHSELSAEQERQARRTVYRSRKLFEDLLEHPTNLYELPADVLNSAHNVGNTFNRLGYLVHLHLIPEEIVLGGYASIIARSWIVLEPFVHVVRNERPEPEFQTYFELLANMALDKYIAREQIQFTRYTDGLWAADSGTTTLFNEMATQQRAKSLDEAQ